jgi:hypothetical protein
MKTIKTEHGLIKGWWDYVPVEEEAIQQLVNVANLPFIHKWVASMPDKKSFDLDKQHCLPKTNQVFYLKVL